MVLGSLEFNAFAM